LFDRPAERLYPIIDADVCRARGLEPLALALACFRGGALVLQVRVKGGSSASFLAVTAAIVEAARPFGAAVIVNDRADIALMTGAAGVHVGQEDIPPDDLRPVFAGTIGVSTHDEAQASTALASSANYIAVGPVFGTATKDTGYPARGLGLVSHAAAAAKPVVAIGGITLERAPEVIAAGAASVAVITDILTGADPEQRVQAFLRALE
jgi:thiamine-phosphate pyrophosphorylase